MPVPSDVDDLWDYSDPEGSEARFRAAVIEARTGAAPEGLAELLSQLARSLVFQDRLHEARDLLDEADGLLDGTPSLSRERARCALERGRLHGRAGEGEPARLRYLEALDLARSVGADFFAVDAAHMLGIQEGPDRGREWQVLALELAEGSADPRARMWLGSLHYNMGITHFERGEYGGALRRFRAARLHYAAQEDAEGVRQAVFCAALALRLDGKAGEALGLLEPFCREAAGASRAGLFVRLEAGLCLLALARQSEAVRLFAECHALIRQRPSLARGEPGLARWLAARLDLPDPPSGNEEAVQAER